MRINVGLRWPFWLRQHPLFDEDWYVRVNRDVRHGRLRPWWHYVRHGIREGREPNAWFDREWYLRTYPDVRAGGIDPLDHYYRIGCWEGHDPSPRFDNDAYLAEHPELVRNGTNPLLHFLRSRTPELVRPWPRIVPAPVATAALPSASIVVPVWNDASLIAECLRSFDETVVGDVAAEVIVVDDGSDVAHRDGLQTLLAGHARARLLRRDINGGYIAAVNSGAGAARHDIVVLLNNDTVLLPGWLEPLLQTLQEPTTVGVVGGRLLYPDGRLQEAGGALFQDGSATRVGNGDPDPDQACYARSRSVDYVSGALLATPRALFDDLGGLDPVYGFGYLEDADYCLRVRHAGRDVVYEPRSRIIHLEGGTVGVDMTQGPRRLLARNQRVFVDRWRAVLSDRPVRPQPLDLHASRALIGPPDPG